MELFGPGTITNSDSVPFIGATADYIIRLSETAVAYRKSAVGLGTRTSL